MKYDMRAYLKSILEKTIIKPQECSENLKSETDANETDVNETDTKRNVLLYLWSKMRKRRATKALKKKRRFPAFTVGFLAFMALLYFIPLGGQSHVAATSAQTAQHSVVNEPAQQQTPNNPSQSLQSADNSPTYCSDIDPLHTWCKGEIATVDECNKIDIGHTWCHPVTGNWVFPCADPSNPQDQNSITYDWLSGDEYDPYDSAHLSRTLPIDTYNQNSAYTLWTLMEESSTLLLAPVIILIGYQLLLGATSFRHANALEALGQVLIGALAVGLSYTLVVMMINLTNGLNEAIVALHASLGYPEYDVNSTPVAFKIAGDTASSYRGIVTPMSQWGCAANNFVSILSTKFMVDSVASVLPGFGGLVRAEGAILDAVDMVNNLGGLVRLIFSVALWAQELVRIILINYNFITAPLAFACWALPGGVGKNVVKQWFKGFASVLLVQTVQLFILTTLPLIFPKLPNIPVDSYGIMQAVFAQLPPLIVLVATVRAPKMMGSSAARLIASAGAVAGGAVTAAGAALYNFV